jgi:hypothetical protein
MPTDGTRIDVGVGVSVGAGDDVGVAVGVGDGFSPGAEVLVRQTDAKDWKVERSFDYGGKTQLFHVGVGEDTDFASVPRVLVWFLPRYGKYTLPAILHDHLWRIEAPRKHISYRDADATLRRAMRERGVPFLTRWIMWAAVRWASLATRPGGRKDWWRDAPVMVVITVPTLALLLPAILAVTVTLLVVHVLEWLFYLPLRLNQALRMRSDKPAKKVNPPEFGWTL